MYITSSEIATIIANSHAITFNLLCDGSLNVKALPMKIQKSKQIKCLFDRCSSCLATAFCYAEKGKVIFNVEINSFRSLNKTIIIVIFLFFAVVKKVQNINF